MPEIIIDGKPVQFTQDDKQKANIIQLANTVGVHIPGFCYHPGLSVSGNCRMCMVEVGMPAREKDGSLAKDESGNVKISFMPKLQPACYQEPADGMVIRTNTEKVIENRKYIMQFLLANHPLDCPECDQAGECVLQDFAFQYGFAKSKFFEEKRTFVSKNFSDVITPELNRCIHCDRCARFTKEIAHDYSFTRTWRGNSTELSALPGDKITHNYQGNMVDVCPVGALTLTDFRFKSRVWFLKHNEGLCSSCGKGCNVVYAVNKENNVLRIKPRYNKDVNSFWMCDYGRLRYGFYNQNRRRDPLVEGVSSKPAPAIEKAAKLIGDAKTVGVLASANETIESMKALADFTRQVLKTPHVDFRVHSAQMENNKALKAGEVLLVNDPYPNSEGAIRMELTPGAGGMNATDILNSGKTDLLLVVTDDKCIENPDFTEALGKVQNKNPNCKMILFSPFVTPVDSKASVVFPIPSSIEQAGTFINVDGVTQKFKTVVNPPAGVQTLAQTLEQLTQKLAGSGDLKPTGAAFT